MPTPLSQLQAESSSSAPSTDTPEAKARGPVLLDYHGNAGPDHEFEHVGPMTSMISGRGPFTLQAGLNIVDADEFAAYEAHPPVAQKIADGWISIVTLAGMSPGSMLELASRTRSGDALEHMLATELKKPQTGGPRTRRDPKAIDALEKGLRRAPKGGGPSFAGVELHGAAAAELIMGTAKFKATAAATPA